MAGGLMLFASAWGAWVLSCLILSIFKLLPAVRCMQFLEHARDRGVLRQAGGVYQFRHVSLQDRVAEQFIKDVTGTFVGRWQIVKKAQDKLEQAKETAAGSTATNSEHD